MGKARHAVGRDLKKRGFGSPHVQKDTLSDTTAKDKGSPPHSPGPFVFIQGKES